MSDSDRVLPFQANSGESHLPQSPDPEDILTFPQTITNHHTLHNHTGFLNNLGRTRSLSLPSSDMDAMDIVLHHQQHQIGTSHLDQELINIPGLHQVQTFGKWVAPPTATVHELQEELLKLHSTHEEHDGYSQSYKTYHTSLSSSLPNTPDLLNLLRLSSPWSAASFLTGSSITRFTNPPEEAPNFHQTSSTDFVDDVPSTDTTASSSLLYDPLLFHLNLPHYPQAPPVFRELFQSHNTSDFPTSINAANNFSGADHDMDANGCGTLYNDADDSKFDHGLCKDTAAPYGNKGKDRENTKNEKQRRQHLTDNFQVLRSLIPNPTKNDRASVVGDAIEYIKTLSSSVNDLKKIVERKKCLKESRKRVKTEEKDVAFGDMDCLNMKGHGNPEHDDPSSIGPLRSSRLHKKSRDAEVDVRVVDDDVTIKLVQRKKINCLLFVSKVLEDLELDIHHVAGGYIGDYCSFLFNTKKYEGSAVYASAVASKLMEVMDTQYAYAASPLSTHKN